MRKLLALLLLSGCAYQAPYPYPQAGVPLPASVSACRDNPYAPPYPYYNPNNCAYGQSYKIMDPVTGRFVPYQPPHPQVNYPTSWIPTQYVGHPPPPTPEQAERDAENTAKINSAYFARRQAWQHYQADNNYPVSQPPPVGERNTGWNDCLRTFTWPAVPRPEPYGTEHLPCQFVR